MMASGCRGEAREMRGEARREVRGQDRDLE